PPGAIRRGAPHKHPIGPQKAHQRPKGSFPYPKEPQGPPVASVATVQAQGLGVGRTDDLEPPHAPTSTGTNNHPPRPPPRQQSPHPVLNRTGPARNQRSTPGTRPRHHLHRMQKPTKHNRNKQLKGNMRCTERNSNSSSGNEASSPKSPLPSATSGRSKRNTERSEEHTSELQSRFD